jgi:hypothetical protein
MNPASGCFTPNHLTGKSRLHNNCKYNFSLCTNIFLNANMFYITRVSGYVFYERVKR